MQKTLLGENPLHTLDNGAHRKEMFLSVHEPRKHRQADGRDGTRGAEVTKLAVNFPARRVTYEAPPQDLRFPLSRIPTFPRSGFVITRVKGIH